MEPSDSPFGKLISDDFCIGDIVEWSKWCPIDKSWKLNYGLITNISNKIKSNRLVSVCTVIPMKEPVRGEIELFTFNLRII